MSRKVKLDITKISDELYDEILAELKAEFGENETFDEWEVSAIINANNEEGEKA